MLKIRTSASKRSACLIYDQQHTTTKPNQQRSSASLDAEGNMEKVKCGELEIKVRKQKNRKVAERENNFQYKKSRILRPQDFSFFFVEMEL